MAGGVLVWKPIRVLAAVGPVPQDLMPLPPREATALPSMKSAVAAIPSMSAAVQVIVVVLSDVVAFAETFEMVGVVACTVKVPLLLE